ncbi:hypothetical protein [Streptomyces sp. NPDC058294]
MSDPKHRPKPSRRPSLPRAETVITGMVVVLFAGMALRVIQSVSSGCTRS